MTTSRKTPVQLQTDFYSRIALSDSNQLIMTTLKEQSQNLSEALPELIPKQVAPVDKFRFASVRVQNILLTLFRYLKVFPIERF